MVDYLYDGTFFGFLTAIYHHYYKEKAAGIYPADRYQSSLLHPSYTIETNAEQAERVYEAIGKKISEEALKRVFYVFLSNHPDKDNIALRYLLLGFRLGGKISNLHSHPVVLDAQTLSKKVSFEVHRLTGLVRFSAIKHGVVAGEKEILYAHIEPDHDVLELLGEHFTDRFRNDPFILHDIRREKGLFYQNGEWVISPLERKVFSNLPEEEREYRRLWQLYFNAIAIEQRANSRCQRNFMPVRYWKHLTEMKVPFDTV